jgi:uncharacterized protein
MMRTEARADAPRVPQVHLFATEHGPHLLVADGSRLYQLDAATALSFEEALAAEDADGVDRLLTHFGLDGGLDAGPRFVDDEPLRDPPVRAFSLAVAQKCNLGCTYCYAQEGAFGGAPRSMPVEVAQAAVDRLLSDVEAGGKVNLAFLGGEPLANRAVLRAATERAAGLAAERGIEIGFSITTNGTLLSPEDGELFERHGFAVTVSLDGIGEVHDRLRPFKGGAGSFEQVIARVDPLLRNAARMQVSARVTVTPRNLHLPETLDRLIEMGFHSVGFSPMLSSPTGRDEMARDDLATMLDQMIACGREFESQVAAGRRYPFANLVNAMKEIHRGTHRPYPCGAGAGYLGVSAEGDLFACHRFVDDEPGAMGNLRDGVDRDRQAAWLAERHVHRQEPCRSCWARYLCGGGCHHEVIHRGRPACDYIRGWLHYCLGAYVRISALRPELFGLAAPEPAGA